jgi:hypothetical protein
MGHADIKMAWNGKTKGLAALLGIAVYVILALWLKYSYMDPALMGREVALLPRPFERFGNAAVASSAHHAVGSFDALADSEDNEQRSPVILYEDGTPLAGPAHSSHADIANIGRGRFSHWKGQGFVFSASDNSDPNTNGRTYRAAVPR